MERTWHVKERAPREFSEGFPEFSPVTLQLLWSRGLRTQKAIDEFFNPDYEGDLHNPFLYLDMEKAVAITRDALQREQKIHVFADYDHDGISGAAILTQFFRELGVDIGVYIPDRNQEGYGLNEKAIKEIADGGAKILITIDCGTSNVDEVRLAKSLGMRVIILDHHLVHGDFPDADAFVNAERPDDPYPCKWLSGAGVCFKFVQALIKDDHIKNLLNQRKSASEDNQRISAFSEKWYLDLVAIAAVGDIVPLLGENRTLVKYGLVVLAQTRRPGLRALMKIAGLKPRLQKNLDPECKIPETNLDTYSLGFIIVPRLNAASRMDHANMAFELLVTDDTNEAEVLSRRLEEKNRERQEATAVMLGEIEKRLKEKGLPRVIIEGGKEWSTGILGLVASKLSEKYSRPVFLFHHGPEMSRGSCRALEPFDVVRAMEGCAHLFEDFGGHAEAGGFTIHTKHLDELQEHLLGYAEEHLTKDDFIPKLEIDAEITPEEITWEFYDELEKFEPFGEENPRPIFLLRNTEISGLRFVGENGKHLQLNLRIKNQELGIKNFRAIYFRGGEENRHLEMGDRVDVVFELIAEEWNGTRELRLKIVDLKKHE